MKHKACKRVVSFLLSLICVTGCIGTGIVETDAKQSFEIISTDDSCSNLVDDLGIYNGDAENKLSITRAEFAIALAKLMKFSSSEELADDPYEDFRRYEYGAVYIQRIKESGFMIGDDNLFRPNDAISAAEAMIVAVRAAGYDYRLEGIQSPQTEALRIARQIGLAKKVNTDKQIIDENDLRQIFYNILISGIEEKGGKYSSALLNSVWGLDLVKGTVYANSVSGLYNAANSAGENHIIIGETSYYDLTGTGKDLLGHSVTAFVNKDTDRIEFIYENKNNSIFLCDPDIAYDSFLLTYESDNGKKKKINLSKNFAFIYNGKSTMFEKSYFELDDTEMTFVDVEQDGLYDLVVIEKYNYDLTQTVNLRLGSIQTKYSTRSVISEKNTDVDVDLYYNDSLSDSIENVKTDMLMKYYENDGYNKVYIYENAKEIFGELSGKGISDGSKYVMIDGEKYSYNSSFEKYFKDIQIGTSGKFIFDSYGRISAMTVGETGAEYGYVLNINFKAEMSKRGFIRLLTQNDEIKVYELEKKVRIDGQLYKIDEAETKIKSVFYENGIIKRQPIKYNINDEGNLYIIDTKTIGDPMNININAPKVNDSLTEYYTDNSIYFVKTASGPYDRSYTMSSDTVLFIAPPTIKTEPGNNYEDDDFRVTTISEVPDRTNQKFDAFDIDEYGVAKMAIWYTDAVEKLSEGSPSAVCSSSGEAYDEKEEGVRKQVTYWYNGEFHESFIDEDKVSDIPLPGDVFMYSQNIEGDIVQLEIKYRIDESINMADMASYGYRYAEPKKIIGNYLCCITNKSVFSYYNLAYTKFVVVNKKTGNVRTGTIYDIEIDNCVCFLVNFNFAIQTCVIYI